MQEEDEDWTILLQLAYESGHGTVQWPERLNKDDPGRKENNPNNLRNVDLSPEKVERALRFVERTGLMSQVGSGKHYELTEKGFNVAHERELNRQQQGLMEAQNDATQTLATFTVVLGSAALVQAAAGVLNIPYPTNALLGVIYVGILLALWIYRDKWILMQSN